MTQTVRQATCVAVNGRAILIEGEPGIGKTSLALALIDRDATLVGDDAVTLEVRGDVIWASPPPNTRGLIEVRNVGIVTLPTCEAPVALLVRLSPDAERLPEAVTEELVSGLAIPVCTLFPKAPALPLRAEWALEMHGLKLG